jgi:hypothetical protein
VDPRLSVVEAGFDPVCQQRVAAGETHTRNLEDAVEAGVSGAPFYTWTESGSGAGSARTTGPPSSGNVTLHTHTHLYEGRRAGARHHCIAGHSGAWRGMAAAPATI